MSEGDIRKSALSKLKYFNLPSLEFWNAVIWNEDNSGMQILGAVLA
jgi:hypothetical protein